MRLMSAKLHGALDYLVGILLILAPWVLGFAMTGSHSSCLLCWEPASYLGRFISGSIQGVACCWQPRRGSSASQTKSFWPHLLIGLLKVGAGLMTRTTIGRRARA